MKPFIASKKVMLTVFVCAVCIAGLTASQASAKDILFTGVVVKKDVPIRAGAGSRYYIVGHVKKGAKVAVKDVIFGWNKIAVPQGVYSYILKSAVDANSKKTAGTVSVDGAKVTAVNLKDYKQSYREQTTLSKGAKVKIAGANGDFYKIASPQSAAVFLPPGSVRRAKSLTKQSENAESAAGKKPNQKNNSQPETAPSAPATKPTAATRPTTRPTAPNTKTNKTKVKTPAQSEALKKVEIKMLPYFSQPVSAQPLDKMKAAYEKVASDTKLSKWDQNIVKVRLAMINRNQKIAATLAHIKQVTQKIAEAEKSENQAKENATVHYDIVGYLEVSKIYDGESMPRLYRITDSQGYTLAYISPKLIQAHKMLGRIVGIMGKEYHNATLDINIFKAKKIDVLKSYPKD